MRGMVAIRFKLPEQRADGFMLLVRRGKVRSLRDEIYVCSESALKALEEQNIAYEKVPLPTELNTMDALRDTPALRFNQGASRRTGKPRPNQP